MTLSQTTLLQRNLLLIYSSSVPPGGQYWHVYIKINVFVFNFQWYITGFFFFFLFLFWSDILVDKPMWWLHVHSLCIYCKYKYSSVFVCVPFLKRISMLIQAFGCISSFDLAFNLVAFSCFFLFFSFFFVVGFIFEGLNTRDCLHACMCVRGCLCLFVCLSLSLLWSVYLCMCKHPFESNLSSSSSLLFLSSFCIYLFLSMCSTWDKVLAPCDVLLCVMFLLVRVVYLPFVTWSA